jgi:hypothetical protein
MTKHLINKNVSEVDLNKIFESIDKLNLEFIYRVKQIFKNETTKGRLYKSSHLLFSVANRAIALNKGYKLLAENNNYISAISLIRLQVDNCLRLFAMSLVKDRRDFYKAVVNGIHIGNMKDAEGNSMTDEYLVTKIDKMYPQFKELYKNTSGFIHFSNEHLNINNIILKNNDESLKNITLIEGVDRMDIVEKVDFSFNMFYAGKCLLKLINGYRLSMEDDLIMNK